MSNISSFRSTREQTRTAVGDTVMGQAGKRVGSDSDLPPMKRTSQPNSAGGGDWGDELEVPGRQELGEAGREGRGEVGMRVLGEVVREGLGAVSREGLVEVGREGVVQVGREGLRDAGRRGLGEAGMEDGGGQAAGVQEGRSQGGAAGMGAGRGVGGLKAACQQKQAVRRHLFDQGSLPPYQLICRLLNTGAACYLNSAINLMFSSLQFNDTFSVIKLRGPLTNQLYLLCDSYPGQVRQLYLYLESRYLLPIDFMLLSQVRDIDYVRMLVANSDNSAREFRDTIRHQDPGEFMIVLLRAIRVEMQKEENAGRMLVGTSARFGHLFAVEVALHQWCQGRHHIFKTEEETILQLCVLDPVTLVPLDTLGKVINTFCAQSEIKGSKCPQCEQSVLQRREPECPPVLILQYVRFVFDKKKKTAVKLDHDIEAPETLSFGGSDYQMRGFIGHRGETCDSGH